MSNAPFLRFQEAMTADSPSNTSDHSPQQQPMAKSGQLQSTLAVGVEDRDEDFNLSAITTSLDLDGDNEALTDSLGPLASSSEDSATKNKLSTSTSSTLNTSGMRATPDGVEVTRVPKVVNFPAPSQKLTRVKNSSSSTNSNDKNGSGKPAKALRYRHPIPGQGQQTISLNHSGGPQHHHPVQMVPAPQMQVQYPAQVGQPQFMHVPQMQPQHQQVQSGYYVTLPNGQLAFQPVVYPTA